MREEWIEGKHHRAKITNVGNDRREWDIYRVADSVTCDHGSSGPNLAQTIVVGRLRWHDANADHFIEQGKREARHEQEQTNE